MRRLYVTANNRANDAVFHYIARLAILSLAARRHEIRLSLSTKQFAAVENIYSIDALSAKELTRFPEIAAEIFFSEAASLIKIALL